MRATGLVEEENQRKVAIFLLFLHYVGQDAMAAFNSFTMDMDVYQYVDLINRFEAHCKPKTNETVERDKFLTKIQKINETVHEFVTPLKNFNLAEDW